MHRESTLYSYGTSKTHLRFILATLCEGVYVLCVCVCVCLFVCLCLCLCVCVRIWSANKIIASIVFLLSKHRQIIDRSLTACVCCYINNYI